MGISSITVLIVDDEPAIRESLQDYLEDYGFRVTAVASSEAALEVLECERHDVLIVDLRLPGISGETLVLEVHQRYPGIKFIIHTGSVDDQLSEDLRALGMRSKHMILKPVTDMVAIVNLITKLVNLDGWSILNCKKAINRLNWLWDRTLIAIKTSIVAGTKTGGMTVL